MGDTRSAVRRRGVVLFGVLVACFAPMAAASSGGLDPTFGVGGWVATDMGSTSDAAWRVALQPDGKIVAAGWTAGAGLDVAMARYGADGNLDPTFGTAGRVTTAFRDTGDDLGLGLVVQPDGKIVVAGITWDPPVFGYDIALARYLADGSLDPSFGQGGKVVTDCPIDCRAVDIAIQADGKLVVAGGTFLGTNQLMVARYMAGGALDPSFGGGGFATLDLGIDPVRSIELQSDGKIVIAGSRGADVAIVRLTTGGALDGTFGSGGVAVTSLGGPTDARGLAIGIGDAIVVAGVRGDSAPDQDVAVVQYLANGTLDPQFGSGGIVVSDVLGGTDEGNAVAVQPNGKPVVVGSASTLGGPAFLRYETNGTLDPSFGTGGVSGFNPYGVFESLVTLTDIAIQPDGRIVAAGRSGAGDFALARLEGAGTALEQLAALLDAVDALHLGKLGSSLHDKLVTMQRMLLSGKTAQTCEDLDSFQSQVAAQRGKALTPAQANDLTTRANELADTIGC